MLNRAATSVALILLGEPKRKQTQYFLCTYLIVLIPIAIAGLTQIPALVVCAAILGLVAWWRWFRLVRSSMSHFADLAS